MLIRCVFLFKKGELFKRFQPFFKSMKVLKIGGSAITDKSGYRKELPERIDAIADVISKAWKSGIRDLVIVHGAGSFGHQLVIRHGINNGVKNDEQKLGFADTHAACSELSLFLVKQLISRGVPAISIPPSALIIQDNKRISEFNDRIVLDYLADGYLPVLYGDFVPDKSLGGSPCSGDQIMAWFGKDAEFLVFATNVDGVLDENGTPIPEITKQNFREINFKETSNDVTGAMEGKINELLEVRAPSYIVNAHKPERILDILEGRKTVATVVHS
jgi:isopentenyl phosphate kinase